MFACNWRFRGTISITALLILGACCPNPERLARGDPPTGMFGEFFDSFRKDKSDTQAAVKRETPKNGKAERNLAEYKPAPTPVVVSTTPPPPLKSIPVSDQALHIAIAKGYLSGLSKDQNWFRRVQVKVDGILIWEGDMAFGDEKGPSRPEVSWLPAPVLTARGPHQFSIIDLSAKSEISGTYSCASSQCWAIVTYAKDKNKLDLIEFLDEEPKF